ncbi:ATP-dependent DNA helicase [Alkaliphilus hydrothermalis]|uniref:DNA excision repair protein ERCC-2 n=1 Tax=Alkaliphilus hydrothermalis TaxID=1482730 RepID=A0ABS2NRB3_9FIRM|nr:ATP-dependent DNA helicase [Alkaliphilus hydrothermalis]MBM7615478.1 DNA excision repair protein ERCC-2 [Alkaliphilus hydrothermalis]
MSKLNEIKISVRNLVEFVLRSGDIDTSFRSSTRAVEGTRAHQKVQKAQGDDYEAEVSLKHQFQYKDFRFVIEGRVDGIIDSPLAGACIDEIKSTTKPLEEIHEDYNHLHWAQAKCYGYIYCWQNNLECIDIQLTYFHLKTEESKIIRKSFNFGELESYFFDIIDKYIIWASFTAKWRLIRDASIEKLEFPFQKYRRGQRKLAIEVYRSIKDQKRLFVKAPTGIGKTISTLFPTIKALGEGHTSKIFYLTAKTITRQVAEEAFVKMRKNGLRCKTVTLTAKDKICFKEQSICEPEYCQYAQGHFNRVNEGILDILEQEDHLSREAIEAYAEKHTLCPFEFSLDLALWADTLICDYNYIFDPRVYLKRFFDTNNNDYSFLIDEAHNLVDRAREMFSATLYKSHFLDLKKIFKDQEPEIAKALNKLNAYMLKMKKLCGDGDVYTQKELTEDILYLLNRLMTESEEFLATNKNSEGHKPLLELFFECLAFTRIAEFYDERYVIYVEQENKDVKLKIFCLDPSYLLREAIKRGKSAVFFSATLSPIEYFKEILGGEQDDQTMLLPSPFPTENLCLMIASNVSTKYKDRGASYGTIVKYIETVASNKRGNYLVFFPSYKYMNDVYEDFVVQYPQFKTLIQNNIMSEEEREDFLEEFKESPHETLIGFAVMGGIFSEGIDLKGSRLSGAIIVGVGLPQICLERNIVRDYFNRINQQGFNYSYIYPGMNKVLQAAGRVIRTEEDKGVVLLIDERFNTISYKKIFPHEWRNALLTKSKIDINKKLKAFF